MVNLRFVRNANQNVSVIDEFGAPILLLHVQKQPDAGMPTGLITRASFPAHHLDVIYRCAVTVWVYFVQQFLILTSFALD